MYSSKIKRQIHPLNKRYNLYEDKKLGLFLMFFSTISAGYLFSFQIAPQMKDLMQAKYILQDSKMKKRTNIEKLTMTTVDGKLFLIYIFFYILRSY